MLAGYGTIFIDGKLILGCAIMTAFAIARMLAGVVGRSKRQIDGDKGSAAP
jgi:hypothetical protein